jgi:hypothetical protein
MRVSGDLRRRLAKLEQGHGDVIFELPNGAARVLRRSWLLRALDEAITGGDTWQARAMLTAVSVTGGGRLHELAQALAAGPNLEGEL